MGGGPSSVFAAGLGAAQSWNGAEAWGALGCPGSGSCPAPPLDISLAQLSGQWHQGEQESQESCLWLEEELDQMCLSICWVFWDRIGVGGGRTGSRNREHSGEEQDALWSCCFPSSVPLPPFTSHFHFFVQRGRWEGKNPCESCWPNLPWAADIT